MFPYLKLNYITHKNKKLRFSIIIILILSTILEGCWFYSFTGASIPPEAKTVSIKYFPNRADLINPSLSQLFTEALQQKFSSQTNLTLVDKNGDLHFEGYISGYSIMPVAIQSNETAALNRLTITVVVKFSNKYKPENDFETTFSRYKDYDKNISLASIENDLIRQINEELVEDIFNKAVVNW